MSANILIFVSVKQRNKKCPSPTGTRKRAVEKPHYQHGICLPLYSRRFRAKSQVMGILHDYPKSNQIEKRRLADPPALRRRGAVHHRSGQDPLRAQSTCSEVRVSSRYSLAGARNEEADLAYISERQSSLSPATIRTYRNIKKNRFQDAMDRRLDTSKPRD